MAGWQAYMVTIWSYDPVLQRVYYCIMSLTSVREGSMQACGKLIVYRLLHYFVVSDSCCCWKRQLTKQASRWIITYFNIIILITVYLHFYKTFCQKNSKINLY